MPYDEYTHDPYAPIQLEPPIDRYARTPERDYDVTPLPGIRPDSPGTGTGILPIGKYQYTPEEYFTGERVERDGSVSVVIPERKKAVEETGEALNVVGKTTEKLYVGAVVILILVIVAGIVT